VAATLVSVTALLTLGLTHWTILASGSSDMLPCGVSNMNLTGLTNWSAAGDIKPTCSLINFVTFYHFKALRFMGSGVCLTDTNCDKLHISLMLLVRPVTNERIWLM
jgi:hypothetical protein